MGVLRTRFTIILLEVYFLRVLIVCWVLLLRLLLLILLWLLPLLLLICLVRIWIVSHLLLWLLNLLLLVIGIVLLASHRSLRHMLLAWVHHGRWLLDGHYLLLLHEYLVVFVSSLVPYFVLIMRTSPFPVNYEFVLMEARWELLDHGERSIWHFLHRDALLPFVERAYDLDIIATVPPGKHILRESWLHLWWRLVGLLLLKVVPLWHVVVKHWLGLGIHLRCCCSLWCHIVAVCCVAL